VSRATHLALRAYTRARILRGRLAAKAWNGVRILGYHRVCEEPHVLSVRPARFREQIEAVLASDATPISLAQALDLLARGDELGRYVCVTFDDGYRDNLEHAFPLLERYAVPATIFVPTRIIDGDAVYRWFASPPPALSWDDLRELKRSGLVDVQAHTRTHPFLTRVDDDRARDEIVGCRDDFELRLGYRPSTFCYPAGLYRARDVALVEGAGYRAAVSTDPGTNGPGTPVFTLKRTLVYWEDDDERFAAKLAGHLDRPSLLRRLRHGPGAAL
jgi:peptidoglycan/xylan/chitin deacetylase (PgdA/CDA1 family)